MVIPRLCFSVRGMSVTGELELYLCSSDGSKSALSSVVKEILY